MERSQQHIDFLDHIRGIAIIAVFLTHTIGVVTGWPALPWGTWHSDFAVSKSFLLLLPFSFGWAGVSIFFVVSGFCIHINFMRHPDWRAFFLRRFFRIYPPYLFAVLLFGLLVPWTRAGYTLLHKVFQIGSHLALINNFSDQAFSGINPNFWSIAVEVQLYLLYPLLLWLVARWGWRRCLIGLAGLEFAMRELVRLVPIITGTPTDNWWQGLPATHAWLLGCPFIYWFSWSIGAVIADAYISRRPIPFATHSLFLWGVIAFGSYFIKDLACFTFTFFAVLTATGIAKLLNYRRPPMFSILFSRPLQLVGVWSYSLYLLHWPFVSLAPGLAAKVHWPGCPQSLMILFFCFGLWFPIVALAALWHRIFELPSIAAGKRVIQLTTPPKQGT